MIDIPKYVALNSRGDVFMAVNAHPRIFLNDVWNPYENEFLYANEKLNIYKYDLTLLDDARILIAEGLIDQGTTTMKATDSHLIIGTGQQNLSVFTPRLQVIDLKAIDEFGNNTYPVTIHELNPKVKEIIDII